MRRMFTAAQARAEGITPSALRWGVRTGRWSLVEDGVYVAGPGGPTEIERAAGAVLKSRGVASGTLAGLLWRLDGVERVRGPFITVRSTGNGRREGVRRRTLGDERISVVNGVPCTNGLQTVVDLAALVDDLTWEQVLESALRRRLTTVDDVAAEADVMRRSRTPGVGRIRRVLSLRPVGAPPTESLLETYMVQLAREVPDLTPPIRQFVLRRDDGRFVARIDLSWPDIGLFIELDGQHHRDQPVYDASRETAIVAATGWLCGRFTWTEVVHHRRHTIRRLAELVDQSRRRPSVR